MGKGCCFQGSVSINELPIIPDSYHKTLLAYFLVITSKGRRVSQCFLANTLAHISWNTLELLFSDVLGKYRFSF